MKSFISKFVIAAFGLTLATAPLTASAAQWGVGVNVGGPGYSVHAGYGRPAAPPPPHEGWHRYGYGYGRAPAVAYHDGYYGWAPAGYYGYYWHGRWFAHRRWGNGFYIYF